MGTMANHYVYTLRIREKAYQEYLSQKLRNDKKLSPVGSMNLIQFIYETKHQKIINSISWFKEKNLEEIYSVINSKYNIKNKMSLSKNEPHNSLASKVFINQTKKKTKKTFSNKKKKILKEIEDFRAQSSHNVSLPDLVVEQDKNIILPDGTHVIEKKSNNTSVDTRKNTNTKNKLDNSKKMTALLNKSSR